MISDRDLELLNAELDGAIDAAGLRTLKARLDEDDELRRYRAELHAAVRALEASAPYTPPPELRRSLLSVIAAESAAAPPRRRGVFGVRPRPAFAASFAAGIAAGMVLFGVLAPRIEDIAERAQRDLYGSAGAGIRHEKTIVVDEEGLRGRLRFAFAADRVTARVELDPVGTARLEVAHDPGLAVEEVRVQGPAAPDLATAAGHLDLKQAGRGACEFTLRGREAGRRPVTLTLSLDGRVLREHVIEPD